MKDGLIYYIHHIGIKDYIDETNKKYSFKDYFTWFAKKFIYMLELDDNEIYFGFQMDETYTKNEGSQLRGVLQLPSTNKIEGSSFCLFTNKIEDSYTDEINIEFELTFFDKEHKEAIPCIKEIKFDELPSYRNLSIEKGYQITALKDLNNNWNYYNKDPQNIISTLNVNASSAFIIDTRFLENFGLYTISFQNFYISDFQDFIITPEVFIFEMINENNGDHHDGLIILENYDEERNSLDPLYLNMFYEDEETITWEQIDPGVGVGALTFDGNSNFIPQVFIPDNNSTSMIRIHIGCSSACGNIYLVTGNSSRDLIKYCNGEEIKNLKDSWYLNAIKVENNFYHFSLTSKKANMFDDSGNADFQWAIVLVGEELKEPRPDIPLVPWRSGTNAQIQTMIEAYYNGDLTIDDICSVWNVGDTRKIKISQMNQQYVNEGHREQEVELRIIGFEADDLTDPIREKTKALITVELVNCLMDEKCENEDKIGQGNFENGYMNNKNTTDGSWRDCKRRAWCNDTFYNSIEDYIKNLIKPVNKVTSAGKQNTGTFKTSDRCFLLSEREIIQRDEYSSYNGEGKIYEYYDEFYSDEEDIEEEIIDDRLYKKPIWTENQLSSEYYLRSPSKDFNDQYLYVTTNGEVGSSFPKVKKGIAPAFCL